MLCPQQKSLFPHKYLHKYLDWERGSRLANRKLKEWNPPPMIPVTARGAGNPWKVQGAILPVTY